MTLLAAAVFAMIRYGLALVPRLALHWPLKKIAAMAALAAGAAYLVVSGFEVAAQRAYVMTAVVLVAVLLDRPALTMRSVALAAMIVLLVAPESLMQAGFQMSFAAHHRADRGLRGAARAGLVAGVRRRPRAGASRRPVIGGRHDLAGRGHGDGAVSRRSTSTRSPSTGCSPTCWRCRRWGSW